MVLGSASGKFCSLKCAHSYSSKFVDRKKTKTLVCKDCGEEFQVPIYLSKSLYRCNKCKALSKKISKLKNPIIKEVINNNKIIKKICCSKCGAIDKKCKHPEICNLFITQSFPGLIKYLKFDPNCFGSEKFYEEYYRVQCELNDLYYNKEYSSQMLADFYGHPNASNFIKIIKKFINRRPHSEANRLSIMNKRLNIPSSQKYLNGWHTTWNNKQVYYRSSYELDYCNELDKAKIDYVMESQRIKYFDTVKNIWRTAIPDFELLESHTLVEIKSSYTFNKQNMIDKFKQYIKEGWKVELVYNHQHYPNLELESIQ